MTDLDGALDRLREYAGDHEDDEALDALNLLVSSIDGALGNLRHGNIGNAVEWLLRVEPGKEAL